MTEMLQQRDRTIYIVAASVMLGMFVWRRLPNDSENWRMARRMLIAWIIAAEWILIIGRAL